MVILGPNQGLAVRIRALRPSFPILFMSGFAEHAQVRDLIGQSGERLIHKPFTPFELAQKVCEALEATSSWPT